QAEDGIRDRNVTGVQTCALPILGSGWLTETLALQSDLTVKVRTNPAFALAPHDAPVILIGAGSGIAGLRSHWQHRATQLAENTWLVYGERHPDNENFLPFLLPETFACISTAFSQCSSQPHYVQDVLVNHLQHVKHWINNGAYLYICGSQTGMGRSEERRVGREGRGGGW